MSSGRSGAAARAAALHARARLLGAAQAQVHALTMQEVGALAGAAAHFFDALALAEFSGALLPTTARHARRMRHKVLHQVMQADEAGATLRALLLGRDAQLRLFTARSTTARDFVAGVEPGSGLMLGVSRDIDDWSTRVSLPGFRAADVLDRLSQALDDVERRLAAAERRIALQRRALQGGDVATIRETLGLGAEPSPRSPAGVGRPGGPRLTPAIGTRVVRPHGRTPALGTPLVPAPRVEPLPVAAARPLPGPTVPLLTEGAAPAVPAVQGPVVPPMAPAAVAAAVAAALPDSAAPVAAAPPSPSEPAAPIQGEAPAAAPDLATAVPAEPEPVPPPSAPPAPAAEPARGGWLSRAIRAAVRTPRSTRSIPR